MVGQLTSSACFFRRSSGTISSVASCVAVSRTFGALPASNASSQRAAHRHQQSPGFSPANPAAGFSGLKPGDCWCLCAARWKEAFDAGKAPKVRLAGTHEATLRIVPFDALKKHALDLS